MFINMKKLETLVRKAYRDCVNGIKIGNTGARYVFDAGIWRAEIERNSYMPNDVPALIYKYMGGLPAENIWADCTPEDIQYTMEDPFEYPANTVEYEDTCLLFQAWDGEYRIFQDPGDLQTIMIPESLCKTMSTKDLEENECDPIGGISKDPGLYWHTENGLFWIRGRHANTPLEERIMKELQKAQLSGI